MKKLKGSVKNPFYIELIEAMFGIITVLPMQCEVIHSLDYCGAQIIHYQKGFCLKNIQECTWKNQNVVEKREKIAKLEKLIWMIKNPVVEYVTLRSLLYVIMNCFVRPLNYNSVDRQLLRLLLEEL